MNYNAENATNPFWSENSGFMTGRDPLGIQNSSIALYARLLPGMTNLTQRIRFYSTYCWLLKQYDKLDNNLHQKSIRHHYNFFRRAELIIAFLMANKYPGQTGIMGITYASDNINEAQANGYYDINKGANHPKLENEPRLYWDFSSGALGQYYIGTLINLGLVEYCDRFIHIKDRGLALAAAYEKSVAKEVRNRFIELALSGRLTLADIDFIEPMCINKITYKSEEWNFLNNMIFDDDGVNLKSSSNQITAKRKETIGLYLNYCQQHPANTSFDLWVYSNFSNDVNINSARFGWFYYYIAEACHYALESIFWAMLVKLDGRILTIDEYLLEIKNAIVSQITENHNLQPSQPLEDIIISLANEPLTANLANLEKLTRYNSNANIVLAKALELLLIVFAENESWYNKFLEFENYNYLNYQKGRLTEVFDTYFRVYQKIPFDRYIDNIIKLIINDHIATAYRKMGSSDVNLLKFIIEGNHIGHVQTMEPKHTNPRLNTLRNFLIDLQHIDNSGLPILNENL